MGTLAEVASPSDDGGRVHTDGRVHTNARWSPDPGLDEAFILDEDPDLADLLPPELRRAAVPLLRAPVMGIARGPWRPPRLDPRSYGLLVLDGLLGRRTHVGAGVATELLGPGDILRPWEEPCMWNILPPTVDWRVLCLTRVAVLDARITRLIGQSPELTIAFSDRLLRRVQSAQYLMAVGTLSRVEDRLLVSLWHLAGGWGTVTPRGVRLPFRLTHEILGEIVGARRPSVTLAVQGLRQREQLTVDSERHYLLTGRPGDWTDAGGARRPIR